MTSKRKYRWQLSRSGAADLLRRLADTLEEGRDDVGACDISLAGLSKFKIKIDLRREDILNVKFTGREAGERRCEGGGDAGTQVETEEGGEDYPGLKKRMQTAFTAMRDALARGEMPSPEIVSAYLLDSERMQTFRGAEEEAYPAYAALCARLREAVDAGSLERASAVMADLGRFKKECHARFK